MPHECKSIVSMHAVIVKICNNLKFRLSCYANSIISKPNSTNFGVI